MNTFLFDAEVDTEINILSSAFVFSKTENCLIETKHILNVDFFMSKIAEQLIYLISQKKLNDNVSNLKIEVNGNKFQFLIKINFFNEPDKYNEIVFVKYLDSVVEKRTNDTSVRDFLQKNNKFSIKVYKIDNLENVNLNKKYRLFYEQNVNFPMLSNNQLDLIKIADQHVIIQGVAGSGKTNVCIEKLIWCALKNYGGKVLYTTFSRGLLTDTKLKLDYFKNSIVDFLKRSETNKVIFLDNDHKTAIENYLGVFLFANDEEVKNKLQKIVYFFENNVEYLLISDLYNKYFKEKTFADENYFVKQYLPNIKNYNIENSLSKLKNISNEVIFKEIYGLIFGFCDDEENIITKEKYIELRQNNFTKQECEVIYQLSQDYKKHLVSNNITDNNLASYEMLQNYQKLPRYSLIIADEVQDFSQVTLLLFKKIALKLFCAGDALQMINPTYFSFGYLKKLLYEKDIISVAELENNYRNSKKIQEIINELEKINTSKFGTHNFVTTGKSVDDAYKTQVVYACDENIIKEVAKNKFDNFTIVVASQQKKKELRNILKNQEILTVAEIKGLERNTVLLYNLLTDNIDKWNYLDRITLNKKTADENSVFRYYFNIFYVGLSRAKHNLFVLEEKNLPSFKQFFEKEFDCKDKKTFVGSLLNTIGKVEFTEQEYLDRIAQFIKLEQYDNARFSANRLTDDIKRKKQLVIIDVNEKYVHDGKYREAGIKFWEAGLIDEAKKQFTLSGDKILIDLIDAVSQNNQASLNFEIIKYFTDVHDNKVAGNFIVETIKRDVVEQMNNQKDLNNKFKKLRGNKNGK